jgi:hypothetical protein
MNKQIKVKCTKKEFVRLIWDKLGGIFPNVSQQSFQEMHGSKVVKVTLYYSGDNHIGTWGFWFSMVLSKSS